MILADSSAWIEYLNRTGSAVNVRLRELIASDAVIFTDQVMMEVLAGARDRRELVRLSDALYATTYRPVRAPGDYLQAAELHRACRRRGETVRQLADCLIAAVAIREAAPVLADDVDFRVLARHTPLELA